MQKSLLGMRDRERIWHPSAGKVHCCFAYEGLMWKNKHPSGRNICCCICERRIESRQSGIPEPKSCCCICKGGMEKENLAPWCQKLVCLSLHVPISLCLFVRSGLRLQLSQNISAPPPDGAPISPHYIPCGSPMLPTVDALVVLSAQGWVLGCVGSLLVATWRGLAPMVQLRPFRGVLGPQILGLWARCWSAAV